MTTTLKKRTVVIIGGGLASGLVSRHLVAQGYDVLVLEGGFDHRSEFAQTIPSQRDELRWAMRGGDLFQDRARKTYTFRHSLGETAPPARTLGAFPPGDDMGGAGGRWNSQMGLARIRPDAALASQVARRQEVDPGRDVDPEAVRDARRVRASSRTVRQSIRRRRQGGQPRRQDAAQRASVRSARKSKYPQERPPAPEAGLIDFEIRLGAHVTGIDYDRRAKRVTGVRYVDRESGAGYLQPADIVLLAAFTASSTRLLLL